VTNDPQNDEQFYRDTESVASAKLGDHQLALLEPLDNVISSATWPML